MGYRILGIDSFNFNTTYHRCMINTLIIIDYHLNWCNCVRLPTRYTVLQLFVIIINYPLLLPTPTYGFSLLLMIFLSSSIFLSCRSKDIEKKICMNNKILILDV